MLVKVSKTKAYRIELIKMGAKGKTLLSVRQLYATEKDPEFKPSRSGLSIPIEEDEAKRVIKGLVKTLKNEDGKKPKVIEVEK